MEASQANEAEASDDAVRGSLATPQEPQSLIERIYATRSVLGQSGKLHELHSAIDAEEGAFLTSIIQGDPGIRRTLEVGCAYGLSSLHICAATRGRAGAFHTIIDPFEYANWDGAGIRSLEVAGIDFFQLIQSGSELALPDLLSRVEVQFDLIFIDGIHTFDHAMLDCFYATRLLRVGGILILDDIHHTPVRRVANFIKNYPCYEELGSVGTLPQPSWKRRLARVLAKRFDRDWLARMLPPRIFWGAFAEQGSRMIALRKVAEDKRKWNWHADQF